MPWWVNAMAARCGKKRVGVVRRDSVDSIESLVLEFKGTARAMRATCDLWLEMRSYSISTCWRTPSELM